MKLVPETRSCGAGRQHMVLLWSLSQRNPEYPNLGAGSSMLLVDLGKKFCPNEQPNLGPSVWLETALTTIPPWHSFYFWNKMTLRM